MCSSRISKSSWRTSPSKTTVTVEADIPRSTLDRLYDYRRELYLDGVVEDDRVDAAVGEIRLLDDIAIGEADDLDEHHDTLSDELREAVCTDD